MLEVRWELDKLVQFPGWQQLFDFIFPGAGLDKQDGYKEDTSDSQCTQYSSRNCGKY